MQFKFSLLPMIAALGIFVSSCAAKTSGDKLTTEKTDMKKTYTDAEIQQNGWAKAIFAGGCFWCTEAVFEEVKGVKSVVSGYTGGSMKNPTYQAVITDTTGHAEAIQIVYDPKECNYETLLNVHMKTHDPTTLNRQGNDEGIQYRSAIFYSNEEEKKIVENYIQKLNAEGYYSDPVVTEVSPLETFWPAEDYHQDYFAKNPDQSYCVYVVKKKVDKFEYLFPELVKDEYK
ncbi:MAG: peptide-methionine (S)-S-oxide reductase MsrA [Chitinophagales bacterium]